MQSSSKANVDHPADVVTSEDVPWRVQLAVYAAGMFSHSLNGMAMVVLPLWVVSLESTPLLVGVALGSRFALLALLSIHTGSLMDRLGTRRVMLIFGISGGLLHLLYPALPSIGALIVLQAFAGLTGSMGWIGSQALVGQLMRGNATCAGRLSFSLRIGAFLGPPLVGLTWDYVGPWGAFPMLSGWAFCSVIAAALVPVDRDKSPGPVRVADLVPRPSDYTQAFRLVLVPAIALVVAVTVVRHTAVSISNIPFMWCGWISWGSLALRSVC